MSWKMFSTTFIAIFIAEMGDKTQLAAFAMSGGTSSKWTVFVAASLALIATTAIAVVAGGAVGKYVPAHWVRRGAGAMFIVIGIWFLLAKAETTGPPNAAGDDASQPAADGP